MDSSGIEMLYHVVIAVIEAVRWLSNISFTRAIIVADFPSVLHNVQNGYIVLKWYRMLQTMYLPQGSLCNKSGTFYPFLRMFSKFSLISINSSFSWTQI